MVSLTAQADYGLSGQFIARITGRDSKFTFAREFLGRKGGKRNETTSVDVDEPGLYECCDIDRKKGKVSRFMLVIEYQGKVEEYHSDKEDAMSIAKAMDQGRSFEQIVQGGDDGYTILSPSEAKKSEAACSLDEAIDGCWAILQSLPASEAKKALSELKRRVQPPKEAEKVDP